MVGGGSRVPKVQELLTNFINRELGKNLNTDESAAMGAVYKAADLSSGFKVPVSLLNAAYLRFIIYMMHILLKLEGDYVCYKKFIIVFISKYVFTR